MPSDSGDDFPRPVETPTTTAEGDRPQPIDVEPRGPAHQVHVVRKGDTLFSLAETYLGDGRLWKKIAQANNIQDPSNISVGTRLVIPGE
jgi:5'-nucleotidase